MMKVFGLATVKLSIKPKGCVCGAIDKSAISVTQEM